jgi:hypothetical protein
MSYKEDDETIVATTAPDGRLFVYNGTLYDFSKLEDHQMPSKGSAIALPSIEDYIDNAKISLVNHMRILEGFEAQLREDHEKETDREASSGNGRES